MKYAYISGSITHMPFEWFDIYEKIAQVVRESGMDAYVPHIQTPKNLNTTIEMLKSPADDDRFNNEILKDNLSAVEKSSAIIAEVSNPSIGVGIELGIALKMEKPIIFLAQEKSRVTPLLLGAVQAGAAKMIRYSDQKDALGKLRIVLKEMF